jgi:sulfatase modifying factor 1
VSHTPMRFVPIPGLGIEMSVTPVTQGQWLEMMNSNPSVNGGFRRENYPVENVSAADAETFCALLSVRYGRTYRLPTPVEWNHASLWRTEAVVSGAATDVGWFAPLAAGESARVGLLPPNRYGLHDMLGNVWEWSRGDDSFRWINGGSWKETLEAARGLEFSRLCRSDLRTGNIGFRIVREAP